MVKVIRCPACGALWRLDEPNDHRNLICGQCSSTFDGTRAEAVTVSEEGLSQLMQASAAAYAPPQTAAVDVSQTLRQVGVHLQSAPAMRAYPATPSAPMATPAATPVAAPAPMATPNVAAAPATVAPTTTLSEPSMPTPAPTPVATPSVAPTEPSLPKVGTTPAEPTLTPSAPTPVPAAQSALPRLDDLAPQPRPSIEVPAQKGGWMSFFIGLIFTLFVLLVLAAGAIFENQWVLNQVPALRPVYEKICAKVTCPNFVWSQSQALEIRTTLEPTSTKESQVVDLEIYNPLSIPVQLPTLNVELVDPAGTPLSQRLLEARDYHLSDSSGYLKPGERYSYTIYWKADLKYAPAGVVAKPLVAP